MRQPQQQQQQQQVHVYDDLIGAIDQGTSSTRFLVFEKGTGELVASSQLEIKRITPREGWVEMDPNAIMASVHATMANVHDQLLVKQQQFKISAHNVDQLCDTSFLSANSNNNNNNSTSAFPVATEAALAPATGQPTTSGQMFLKCIGICNQRESAVVWDSKTGQPLYNVIVWMDNRTKDIVDDLIDSIPGRDFNHSKDKTGLPMSTYFSAFKLRWLIDNVPQVAQALAEKRLLVGTVDSWILWNLTGKHSTDVTNASRTFLMDIETLQWDKSLCKQFKVPMEILPKILSSADDFGRLQFGPFMGTPITGVIGDQSAALFGHNCLQSGQTKATFGTGCFIMQNIGPGPLNGAMSGVQREAKRGLITTVAYKLKDKPVCYALEGSIKIAGAALTWLRDNMQLIENYEECDQLVNLTTNTAGVFFVPALGGLYSPYWDPNAAGLFIGLSQFTRREHLVRATFDAIAYQTNDILSLMRGVTHGLKIDGGLCKSENLCQILADITGCDIVRPSMCETSALGAAMVAGCGAGIWDYDTMFAQSNTSHEYSNSALQTNHYPHESLHYDDTNKFSSSLIQTKCFISSSASCTGSNCNRNHHHHHHQLNDNTNNDDTSKQTKETQQQDIQREVVQSTKHHRRSLKQRNGDRLMRNLDAGGGINDDAGGGGGGGGGGGCGPISASAPKCLKQLAASAVAATRQPHHHHHLHLNQLPSLDKEAATAASSSSSDDDGVLMASSDTDFDAGVVVLSSGPPSIADPGLATLSEGVAVTARSADRHQSPVVCPQHAIESSYDLSSGSGGSESDSKKTRLLTSLHHGPPCSSGYNSGDNLELATTNSSSALTDSMRLLADGTRTNSPVESQATDALTASGLDSVATCTDDFANDLKHHNHMMELPRDNYIDDTPSVATTTTTTGGGDGTRANSTTAASQPVVFPSTLANYVGNLRESTASYAINRLGHHTRKLQSPGDTTIGSVQVNNNRKFEANAEDVADEVHEFGGRDSFGEDGYESSTVSFDSFDNDDTASAKLHATAGLVDTLIGCDSNRVDNAQEDDVAYYGDDNDDQGPAAQLNCDINKSIDNHHHHHHHQHHHSHQIDRKKQDNLFEKQMDVFQPYISLEHRTELVDTWRLAVQRSMQWTKVHHEEIRRIDYQRLSSLPISMYAFFSIGLVALSGFMSPASVFM